jgi:hypothetical protein
MNYLDKLKIALKSQGQDESLIDSFASIERLSYVNKSNVESFSILEFLENLHFEGKGSKAVFDYSNFCNTSLSLKGCDSIEEDIANEGKQLIFTQMKRYLSDDFPECNVLGDIRAIPVDITMPQLQDMIYKNEKKVETYIRLMVQSLDVDLDAYEDKIVNIINQYVLSKFNFETQLPSQLANFDMNRADPEVIKKQINVCIDKLLAGENLEGFSL